jgi:microcystin-dependent protein
VAQPYLGQIIMFAGNFAPNGWALCNGQLLSIAQNSTLFALLGTTYGGDGVNTFALPNLQGRVPEHWGTGPGLPTVVIGESGGTPNVPILISNLPQHAHPVADHGAVYVGHGRRQHTDQCAAALSCRNVHYCVAGHLPTSQLNAYACWLPTGTRSLGSANQATDRC